MHVPEENWRFVLLRIRRCWKRSTPPLRSRTPVPLIRQRTRPQPENFLTQVATMTSHPKIFELLKDYMDADSQSERWITVQEFRTYFHLKKSCSPVISGYFQRIYQNPTYLCPYRVIKTEQVRDPSNPYRSVRRYLVKKSLRVPGKNVQKGIRNPFF